MEEDIKILNNFIKMDFKNPMGWTGYYDTELEELRQALAKLLASYKQLKEDNKELNRKLKIKTGDLEYLQNKINKHFISDVEIKARIEELDKSKMYIVTSPVHNIDEKLEILTRNRIKKEILEELLGEE